MQTLAEAVRSSLEAYRADPKAKPGHWDEDRAWMHAREATGIQAGPRDQYLQSVVDRVQWAFLHPEDERIEDRERSPKDLRMPDVTIDEDDAPAPGP